MRDVRLTRSWLAIVILALAVSASAAELPAAAVEELKPVDVRLRPVRWQPLPDEVKAVYVGPDQRVWYQLDRAPGPRKMSETTKAVIEREFFSPAPQLADARPCLFQRGGRVWFIAGIPQRLIAWDGSTWIEHDPNAGRTNASAPEFHFLNGNLAGHGAWYRYGANLQVGDTLLFVLSDGITSYDTKANRWTHQVMSARSPETGGLSAVPDLMPTPDGRGAIALVHGREPALWRWADGAWAKQPPPWPAGAAAAADKSPPRITLVETGVWVIHNNKLMAFYTFDGRPPKGFDALVRQLSADDYATRDRATRVLAGMGPSARPWLEQARRDAGDDEQGLRLDAAVRDLADGAKVALGPAKSDFVDWVRAIDRRHVILNGHDLRGERAGVTYRTFLADVDGPFVELDAARVRGVGTAAAESSGSLPTARPDLAWVPHVDRGRAGLVDLRTGTVTQALPSDRFNWLHAVKADGTLFVGTREPTQPDAKPVMVYQAAAPDDRVALEAKGVTLASEALCVAADGAIWAERADDVGAPGGVARFDGKAWTPVPRLAGVRGTIMLHGGAGGEILVETRDGATLLPAKGDAVRAPSIAALVEANHDAIAAAFPATWRGGRSSNAMSRLFADPAGNVWLKRGGPWKVLTADGWQDGNKAATAAVGKGGYYADQFEPVADGTRVLIADGNYPKGHTFLVGVTGGKLAFIPAPHTFRPYPFGEFVRDREGFVYLPGAELKRVDARGEIQTLPGGGGYPRFVDADGGVWAADKNARDVGDLTIWRGGKPAHTIRVPGHNSSTHFFADRPGSAYAWNAAGLHHFKADKDGQYALAQSYALDDVPGYSIRRECAPLGWFATVSVTGLPRQHTLYLVRLPAN